MLQTFTCSGIGAFGADGVALNTKDATTEVQIAGPSRSGKTSIIRACGLAFLGMSPEGVFDSAAINGARGEVAITLEGGSKLQARQSGSATVWHLDGRRIIARRDFSAFGGPIPTRTTLSACILFPFFWRSLAEKDRARPLREMLREVMREGDLGAKVRALMGDQWREGMPLVLKSALDAQTAANRTANERRGMLKSAEEAHAIAGQRLDILSQTGPTLPEPPDAEKLGAAKRYLAAIEEAKGGQTAYDAALAAYRAAESSHAACIAWDVRRERLGDKPADPGPEPYTEAQVRELEAAWRAACKPGQPPKSLDFYEGDRLRFDLARATERVATLSAKGDPCDQCGYQKPAGSDAEQAEAAAHLEALKGQWAVVERKIQAAKDEAEAYRQSETMRRAREESARKAFDEARSIRDQWVEAHELIRAHRQAMEALGPKPTAIPMPPKPVPPGTTFDPAKTARAHALILAERDHEKATIAAKAVYEQAVKSAWDVVSQAERDLSTRTNALNDAEAAATRSAALVAALRRAPSELAAEAAAPMIDLLAREGITLQWAGDSDTSGPEVALRIDGLPWHLASRGRQIVADAWFRHTLRELAKTVIPTDGAPIAWDDLPLFVDDAQCWSGDWPHMRGVWSLYTTQDDALTFAFV